MKTYILKDVGTIDLTVALPAYSARDIIWLAFESLSRQQKLDFNWELIVMEEDGLSLELLKTYKFPNCNRITYIHVEKSDGEFGDRYLLLEKWKYMANIAKSQIYVMHAADCYSSPYRLYIHYQHFKNKDCYYSCQPKEYFYNILSNKFLLYDGWEFQKTLSDVNFMTVCSPNMATRTQDVQTIPIVNKNKGIDGYIIRYIQEKNKIDFNKYKYIYTDEEIMKDNYAMSLDTDGLNTISVSRKKFYQQQDKIKWYIASTDTRFKSYIKLNIPNDILERLIALHKKITLKI